MASGGSVEYRGQDYNVVSGFALHSGGGRKALVAAVSGMRIVLLEFRWQLAASGDRFRFQSWDGSSGTSISERYGWTQVTAGDSYPQLMRDMEHGLCITATGEGLDVNQTTGTGALNYDFKYIVVV